MNDTKAKKQLVQMAGMVTRVTNSFPFPVAVFLIGAPVTRIPDDPLYSEKTREIIDAYYRASQTTASTKQDKFISLLKVIPPNQALDLNEQQGAFYYMRDSETAGNTGQYKNSQNEDGNPLVDLQYAKSWMGVSLEDIKNDVIVMDMSSRQELVELIMGKGQTMEPTALVRNKSRLRDYISHQWSVLNEDERDPFRDHVWDFPKVLVTLMGKNKDMKVEHIEARKIFADPENQGTILVNNIPTAIVQKALEKIRLNLENLPFAHLSRHQLFVSRVDADRWDEPGEIADQNIIGPLVQRGALCQISVTIINGYGVMEKARPARVGGQ